MSPTRIQLIREILESKLQPQILDIQDQSLAHQGHSGNTGQSETHFSVRIASPKFSGLTLLQKHRLVLEPLQPLFQSGLHSLVVDAVEADV